MKTNKITLTALILNALLIAHLSAETIDEVNKNSAEVAQVKSEKILHKITIEKLEVEMQKTPRFNFNGPRVDQLIENKQWLEIEAKLNIETKSKLHFLPTLDATFYVVTENGPKFEKSARTITFKNVNIRNGEAWICAYVHPDTLSVITKEKRPKVTDITGIAITIDTANLFKGKDQQFLPYAEEIFDRSVAKKHSAARNKNARWWTNIQLSNQKILTLEETPFHAIFSDRYPHAHLKMECVKNEKPTTSLSNSRM